MYEKRNRTFSCLCKSCILAIAIMGFLLYFEVDYLDIGFIALGLWGAIGAWNLDRLKKKKK